MESCFACGKAPVGGATDLRSLDVGGFPPMFDGGCFGADDGPAMTHDIEHAVDVGFTLAEVAEHGAKRNETSGLFELESVLSKAGDCLGDWDTRSSLDW